MSEVSIIVTCKGRLHHLQQALPRLLSQQCFFSYEVVIVDYGCPDGTFAWCESLCEQRLVPVRVEDDTEEFNRSRAHNCGASVADGAVLAFIDADILSEPSWLTATAGPVLAEEADLVLVSAHPGCRDRMGTCAVSSKLFHQVRGYDEQLIGWGAEDFDFYGRCSLLACVKRFSWKLITPIAHGDDQRMRFHTVNSRRKCRQLNQAYLKTRQAVNPNGYGKQEACQINTVSNFETVKEMRT